MNVRNFIVTIGLVLGTEAAADMPAVFRVDQMQPGWVGVPVKVTTLCVGDGELRALASGVLKAGFAGDDGTIEMMKGENDALVVTTYTRSRGKFANGVYSYNDYTQVVIDEFAQILANDCGDRPSILVTHIDTHRSLSDFLADL